MCGRELLALSRYKWVKNGAGECWGCEVSKDRSIPLILSSSHPFISWPYSLSFCWSHVFSHVSQRESQTWENSMMWELETRGVPRESGAAASWEQSKNTCLREDSNYVFLHYTNICISISFPVCTSEVSVCWLMLATGQTKRFGNSSFSLHSL